MFFNLMNLLNEIKSNKMKAGLQNKDGQLNQEIKFMNEAKWLRVKFQELQILHQNPIVQAYYSITLDEKLYFSSVFDDQHTLQIKNDIIIPIQNPSSIQSISLQRWQSHIIVFDHDISLSELKSKSIIKRKFEARKKQIITFSVQLCKQGDIIVCDTLLDKISQHYLILENIRLKDDTTQKRADYGACYFKISTASCQYDIPVQNGNCLIYLPQSFKISQYRNDKLYSSSKYFTFDQLSQSNLEQIPLYLQSSSSSAGKVTFQAHWVIDVSTVLPVNFLLLHSIQLLLSQFEIKFDIPNDFIGSKLRIYCNNKVFEFNDELGNSKMIKIKKAAWIVCKTPNDHVEVKIQRGSEILTRIDILAEELNYSENTKFKQKLTDPSNSVRNLGHIKFNLQKSKGSSNPQNQSFWKQCLKKKSTGSLLIQQLSICSQQPEPVSVLVKTQNQQKTITKIMNINFFEQQPLIYHNPVLINPKNQETIYFVVKLQGSTKQDDFVGIAVLNNTDVKIGKGCYEIDFYKNQQKLGCVNCMITKYLPLTFVKSTFQPQFLPLMKMAELKLSLSVLTLSPYFFTYKYDHQTEAFCIVEVNKIKKVLILQPTYQQLSFIPSQSSDNLIFNIDIDEIIKVKITMMIGDGITEEIYGSTIMSFRMQQLREKQQIQKKDVQFINFAETFVGKCNIAVTMEKQSVKRIEKEKSKEKLPVYGNRNRSSNSKKDSKTQRKKAISVLEISPEGRQQKQIRTIKNLLPTKKHIQKDTHQISFDLQKGQTAQSKMVHKNKFQSKQAVRLPLIKQKKRKQSFGDLLMSMNMRKKTLGGYDYNRPQQQQIQGQQSSRLQKHQKSIDYQNLRNNNPNIDRNFEILFPPKKNQTRQQQIKNELNKYEEKLRGLKSVLNQISNDIDPIEPSVKDHNNTESLSRGGETNNFEYAGNEFL